MGGVRRRHQGRGRRAYGRRGATTGRNAILPGVIGTDRVQATAISGDQARAEHAAKLARIPLARVGAPAEVVSVAVFMLSPESSDCTGALFTADGGFTLGIPHYR